MGVSTSLAILDLLRPLPVAEAVRILDAVSLVYEVDDVTCAPKREPQPRVTKPRVTQPRKSPTPTTALTTQRHPVTAPDDVPEIVEESASMRPTSARIRALQVAAAKRINDAEFAIVGLVERHPEGIAPRDVAARLGLRVQSGVFKAASMRLMRSKQIRTSGNTLSRRYLPAANG